MLPTPEIALILFGTIFLWLILVSFFLSRTILHYRNLVLGEDQGNLSSVLEKILRKNDATEEEINKMMKRIEVLEKEKVFYVRKVGLVRFNPFSDTGGSHSFALAFLDGQDNGIVISSLHSRDQTRIYSKPVKLGKPANYEFSKEEEEAIKKAQKS